MPEPTEDPEGADDTTPEPKYELPTEYGIEVYRTQTDMIGIKQESALEDDVIIVVSPGRVDRLIGYLRAVKDEILTDQADSAEREARTPKPPPING